MKQSNEPSIHRLRSLALIQVGMPFYLYMEEDEAVYVPCMDVVYGVVAANDEQQDWDE